MKIMEFKGKYEFLSNFYPSELSIVCSHNPLIVPYKTVEHFYQASKTTTLKDHMSIVVLDSPGKAKRNARKLKIRSDWEQIKVERMKCALISKFNNEKFKQLLLNTETKNLVEGNSWRDTFWGVDKFTGEGFNMLGKLLMEIRSDLRRLK